MPLQSEEAIELWFDKVAADCRSYIIPFADFFALLLESIDSEVVKGELARLGNDERDYESVVDRICLFVFPRSTYYARLRARFYQWAVSEREVTVMKARHLVETCLRDLARAARRRNIRPEVPDAAVLSVAEGLIPAQIYRRMALAETDGLEAFWNEAQLWDARSDHGVVVAAATPAPPSQPAPVTPDLGPLIELVASAVEERMRGNTCYRCNEEGHWARSCPNVDPMTRCVNCQRQGHIAEACKSTYYKDPAGGKALEVSHRPGGLQITVPTDRTTLDHLETGRKAIEKVTNDRKQQNQKRNQTRRAKKAGSNPLFCVGTLNEPPRSGSTDL